jgi:hypothetical protein
VTDAQETAILKILVEWSPLGSAAEDAQDLDACESEAGDILFSMELYGMSVKRAVAAFLQEAFLVDLDDTELAHYSRKIEAALGR